MKDYVIGLDIGTGSLKALAVDSDGIVLSTAQFSYPLIQESESQCEQDPEQIWSAFTASISKIVREISQNPMAIILSSAMHSIILVDEKDQPITNIITWADNRAGDIAERIQHSAAGEMLYEQTGTPIHAMSPLSKIVWFRENAPDIFAKTKKFISIKAFIWFRLFGVYEVDYSIASAEGLMDIETLRWNENALAIAEITTAQLPELVNTNHARTGADPKHLLQMGLPPVTRFIIGASDGCMANLGSFATKPGVAALTIGTSGAIRVAGKKPVYNFRAMTFNYRLDENTFVSGGPTNNGGVVIKWYAENFLKKDLRSAADYTELLSKVRTIEPGCEGLIFLPYILGERAPIWNSDATGVFFGIRNHHTQEHFTRAVVEGVSMALYNIAESMEQAGLSIDQINVSGGFVHSTEWLEILANIFGKKICLVNASDASALGAAYLGLKTVGKISDYNSLSERQTKEILPDLIVFRKYQKQYKMFQDLYKSLVDHMEVR
jgi:gluconokinase